MFNSIQKPSKEELALERGAILRSNAFRRLKHKTQVIFNPQNDHVRTRMTHTLEVAHIARLLATQLSDFGVSESLTENIALAHDIGHTPFGHAGEKILDMLAKKHGLSGFHHAEHGARVIELEKLPVSSLTIKGIIEHTKGQTDMRHVFDKSSASFMESLIVRASDLIAYLNHDLEDAIRANIIDPSCEDLPHKLLGNSYEERSSRIINDIIEQTMLYADGTLHFSPHILDIIEQMRQFLAERAYFNPIIKEEDKKFEFIFSFVFNNLYKNGLSIQSCVDTVAGMTDRYLLDVFKSMTMPRATHDKEYNLNHLYESIVIVSQSES